MGLQGPEIIPFVREQQKIAREVRRIQREDDQAQAQREDAQAQAQREDAQAQAQREDAQAARDVFLLKPSENMNLKC